MRRVIAQEGRMPARSFTPADLDPDLLRQLYQECDGYVQRDALKSSRKSTGVQVKYSTLTRWLRQLGITLPAVDSV